MDEIHPVAAVCIAVAMVATAEWAWRREKSLAARLIIALGG
jgi:hypothetical protein